MAKNPHDFIYEHIYRGGLKAGASERAAHNAAVTGLSDYKKGKFKEPMNLVKEKIAEAKRISR